jgi:DNA repair protein RadC
MNVTISKQEKIKILNSDDVYAVMQKILLREHKIDRNKEYFWTIGLNTKFRILYIELISMGGTNKTIVEPMQVFRVGVLKGAVGMILVHNHPSGELTPSEADKDITDRLLQVGKIIQIEVLDHLIISEKTYMSFKDTGLLEQIGKSTKYVPDYMLKERMKKDIEKAVSQKVRDQERLEIAKQMKAKGYTLKDIAELTGLPEKVIEKLK